VCSRAVLACEAKACACCVVPYEGSGGSPPWGRPLLGCRRPSVAVRLRGVLLLKGVPSLPRKLLQVGGKVLDRVHPRTHCRSVDKISLELPLGLVAYELFKPGPLLGVTGGLAMRRIRQLRAAFARLVPCTLQRSSGLVEFLHSGEDPNDRGPGFFGCIVPDGKRVLVRLLRCFTLGSLECFVKLRASLLEVRLRAGRKRQTSSGLRLRRFQAFEHLLGVARLSHSALEIVFEGRDLPQKLVPVRRWRRGTSTPWLRHGI
jgi:hypothetical protein